MASKAKKAVTTVDLTNDEDDVEFGHQQRDLMDSQLAMALQSEEFVGGVVVAEEQTASGQKRGRGRGRGSKKAGGGDADGLQGMIGGGSGAKAPKPLGYSVEVSKSNRACCAVCNEKIPKDVVRVSVTRPNLMFSSWQHLKCTIFDSFVTSGDQIEGYDLLSKEELKDEVDVQVVASATQVDTSQEPIDPNELVRKDWSTPLEPPATLLMPLLPYQKEGLGWMAYQEDSTNRGGILADEMGMGKTIQTIALLLHHKPNRETEGPLNELRDISDKAHGFDPATNKRLIRGNTLLVLPTVAIRQWQSELSRFCAPGALTVKVYHGADRETSTKSLCDFDIIITSYKVLEIEFRKATAGTKVKCRICGKKYYVEPFRQHRRYFCGETAKRTDAQAKQKRRIEKGSSSSSSASASASAASSGKKKGKKASSDDEDEDGEPAPCSDSDSDGDIASDGEDQQDDEEEENGEATTGAFSRKGQTSSSKVTATKKAAAPKKAAPPKKATREVIVLDDDDDDDDEGMGGKAEKKRGTKRKMSLPPRGSKKAVDYREHRESDADEEEEEEEEEAVMDEEDEEDEDDEDDDDEDHSEDEDDFAPSSTGKSSGKSRKSPAAPSKAPSKQTTSTPKTPKTPQAKKKGAKSSDSANIGNEAKSDEEGETQVKKPKAQKKKKVKVDSETESAPDISSEGKAKKSTAKKEAATPATSKKKKEEEIYYDEEVEKEIRRAARLAAKIITPKSVLHEISWLRCVLDEAHMIKDRSTSTAKAVFGLVSLYKWCLTGTPLQNRVGELYSLVRFLRIDPHAYYKCKVAKCNCMRLHYAFEHERCTDCQHAKSQHFCVFNREIMNPIKNFGYINQGRRAMLKLKEQLLDEILLRRTKTSRQDDIQLPPRIVMVRQERLSMYEHDYYQAIYSGAQAEFNTYVAAGTVLNNYANIFEVLMRLRQAIDHPWLVAYSSTQRDETLRLEGEKNERANEAKRRSLENGEADDDLEPDCNLCKEAAEDPRRAACGHVFCRDCILKFCEMDDTGECPVCKETLTIDMNEGAAMALAPAREEGDSFVLASSSSSSSSSSASLLGGSNFKRKKNSILNRVPLDKFQSSTKMEALMQELHLMEAKDLGAKAIVFSQFTSMLDLLEYRITLGGIRCKVLKGDMNIDQRDACIKAFNSDPDLKVLLISLKAGGVALNLTVASHIFIMDPWWNPAAEYQAIDRTHRFGQHKPIYATRFIIEDTIEERILSLQEKKRLVFDGTIGGDASSMGKLTSDDMRFLFS